MKHLAIALAALALSACATEYVTPAAGVSLAAISEKDADIADAFARKPALQLPARMAIARVAANGYSSPRNTSYGGGAYSVVTNRDIEPEESLTRLAALPQVAAIAPLSRLVVSPQLSTTRQLREGAAQLRADVLLVYSIDTSIRTDTKSFGPAQLVALGFLRSHKAIVTSTCAYAIFDVRTGFLYGTGETTATETQGSDVWGSTAAIEEARVRAERGAFEHGVDAVGKLWGDILREHAK